ncbi:OST-HTH/LOTUS domain-containing protein [Sulfitobacter geojensis]|uniref:OST-HTH/LOTUS domain-containing protein n=2 Tax=Sulfitobacter geojensis TaxID=1342299 RepID=A0AAE3B7W2_9RHOB|nr:OST-HTH/LOTUS domain-containing protein [Sulfitobacter geojensis]MBM1690630.1 OST-HTH/LOTUS domain-containing protein [Sulfitobacter geojensis]MBM1694696.1 OST-HTH/LOTUS domain-containing protein [Sulfitobacter geojensis]MBM1707598.1 OST-HTH/LOTUS domain-containing protein [Sulfitobacter geojensis]MBM1711208.1 OST-HTH/LOTUS domain-containing protein [Sulfitobacter geojensis]MBM1715723.1 OST-HTH/LOTUS domain-containing protein [Sulfitobacter geojensis]
MVGELIGSYVVADEVDATEKDTTRFPENSNWFSMQMQLSLPEAGFARIEDELKALVLLRNDLVHHFIDQHDLRSLDGCRRAQDALVATCSHIDQNLEQLQDWGADMEKMQRALSEALQSEAFRDIVADGISPVCNVDLYAVGVVRVLREAFGALAVDGWAPVAEAGRWITDRYPGHLPAKYGCRSWRQVVHEASTFEIRYFEMDGQRTACYQERVRPA